MCVYRTGGRYGRERSAGTFPTQRLARARAELVWAEIAAGRDPAHRLAELTVERERTSFHDLHHRWLASRVDLAPKSRTVYQQHGNALATAIGDRNPLALTWIQVQEIVGHLSNEQQLKPATVGAYMSTLRQVLDFADVAPNPARDHRVKMPRGDREIPQPPSRREILAMRQRIEPGPWRLTFDLLEATGMRISEAVNATWADLDVLDRRIRISTGKTRAARRWATVPTWIVEELLDSTPPDDRDPSRQLIPRITDNGMRKRMRRACEDAGIVLYSPHDLRHRWISLALRRGVPIAEVSKAVGHSRQSLTLDTYSHVMLEAGDDTPVAWEER